MAQNVQISCCCRCFTAGIGQTICLFSHLVYGCAGDLSAGHNRSLLGLKGRNACHCLPRAATRAHSRPRQHYGDNLDQLAAFTLGILQLRAARSSSLCVVSEWTFFIPVGFVILSGFSVHHTTTTAPHLCISF